MGKHRAVSCKEPFCSECWKIFKANVRSVMAVAKGLRNIQKDYPVTYTAPILRLFKPTKESKGNK